MSFNTALSGLQAASSNLDVIGNNVANSSTTGFKHSRADFADVYASTAQGTSSNAIGTGVIMSAVSQEFSQGSIEFTQNNLDLAINGNGFYVLNDNGSQVYTRAGAFGVDNQGYIANPSGQRLTGFLADASGHITGAVGDLQLSTTNLPPKATANVSIEMNLNSESTPPSSAFIAGFTPLSPPNPDSYTSSTSTTIYDSLGNQHILTTYLAKAPEVNQWRCYFGIDGTDVTPPAAAVPGGAPPQNYPPGAVAAPFTLVFSGSGTYMVNNPATPPQYNGPTPVLSNSLPIATAGSLNPLALDDLTVNGVSITASTGISDLYSTTDNAASAISISSAINASSNLHGVTATPAPTSVNLGNFTTGNLAAGDLTINGYPITGTVASVANLVSLINAQTTYTGVSATNPSGTDIVLTAADGRNIQFQTDGTAASGATFTNFNLIGGVALDEVKSAQISLHIANNEAIVIGGANPGIIGLGAGTIAGILYGSSDILSISNWDPGTGATSPQAISFDLSSCTQYGSAFSVQALQQDGYTTGQPSEIDVNASGVILARYSNGQSLQLGQVALANFSNVQGLQPVGSSSWIESFSSGPPLLGSPGTANLGVIQSGALEDSNVVITDELVSLIVAQRDFQANAQTIRTEDAVTQAIINLR